MGLKETTQYLKKYNGPLVKVSVNGHKGATTVLHKEHLKPQDEKLFELLKSFEIDEAGACHLKNGKKLDFLTMMAQLTHLEMAAEKAERAAKVASAAKAAKKGAKVDGVIRYKGQLYARIDSDTSLKSILAHFVRQVQDKIKFTADDLFHSDLGARPVEDKASKLLCDLVPTRHHSNQVDVVVYGVFFYKNREAGDVKLATITQGANKRYRCVMENSSKVVSELLNDLKAAHAIKDSKLDENLYDQASQMRIGGFSVIINWDNLARDKMIKASIYKVANELAGAGEPVKWDKFCADNNNFKTFAVSLLKKFGKTLASLRITSRRHGEFEFYYND